MKLLNKTFLFVVMGMLVFAACKKDETITPDPNNPGGTNNPPDTTNTQHLSLKAWKIKSTRLIEQGQTDTTNVNIVGSADWRLTFVADGTGTAIGTFLNGGAFTWVFASNETQVTLTKTGASPITYNFTKTTLNRVIPNITLTLVDGNGNPVGQVSGTVLEDYEKLP